MTLRLEPVRTRRHRVWFRDVPDRLLGGHPAYVPQLDLALGAVLSRRRSPFWKRARGEEWIALRNGQPVGRIGACRDEALFERTGGIGAVGFFDCGEDEETAQALFETAFSWLSEAGCRRARGPMNYCIHDTAGLLVDGFDTPPMVDTTWNPPYYEAQWLAAGWEETQDMIAAGGDLEQGGPERGRRFAERARRKGYRVRPIDLSRYDEEIETFGRIFNEAWDDNWGHVPISPEHLAFKAKDMKAVLDPDLLRIALDGDKPVGVFLGLPDINVPIRRMKGRILPFGWMRLLKPRNRCDGRCRVVTMGVLPGYRKRGIEALLLSDSFAAYGTRYQWCEASWVLADNAAMLNGLALYNLHPYKRWRIYERDLVQRGASG